VKYPEQWREYRRWHLLACYGMLGFPAAVLVAVALKVWAGFSSIAPFVTLTFLWAVLWGWSALRSVRVPCPRCGVPFLSGQEPQFQTRRSCISCGLGLYEQPYKEKVTQEKVTDLFSRHESAK
jgi:hypothetical protein